jgi:hypothetical protein
MRQAIRLLYARYKTGNTIIDSNETEKYSRKELTAAMAEKLNSIR